MSAVTFLDLQVRELCIPFKTTFRHASAERAQTSSLWATARTSNATGYGESCPRPYVTAETIDTARAFCEKHAAALVADIVDVDSVRAWESSHRDEIDANPAAWCALELALLDAMAKEHGVTVEALLNLPPLAGTFAYSAVLGENEPRAFASMADRYRRHGFTDFKLKLSGDLSRDRDKVQLLQGWNLPSLRMRADANNLWDTADAAIRFVEALGSPFWAIEEPIVANRYADLARIGEALGCRIVLDESLVRTEQLRSLSVAPASIWLVNVRVSKMGGLLRSLEVVHAAQISGYGVIVGAQVGETSLLTRAALTVAQSAGLSLVAQEGAFGTELLEHDVVDPPVMFGYGGILEAAGAPIARNAGFGLMIRD